MLHSAQTEISSPYHCHLNMEYLCPKHFHTVERLGTGFKLSLCYRRRRRHRHKSSLGISLVLSTLQLLQIYAGQT